MASKTIALDIGGVCVAVHPERCFGLLGYRSAQEIPVQVLAAIDRLEKGQMDAAQFLAVFRAHAHSALTDEYLVNAWNAMLGEPMPGMDELTREVQKYGHKIVLFSDTSPVHAEALRRKYPIFGHIPDAIMSFVVGAKNPEPAMYAAFEADHGRPDLYIDDRALCIEGGIAAGWTCRQFKGADALRAELEQQGFFA